MSVGYILRQFCSKSGLVIDNPDNRAVAVRFLNEAAKEIYKQSDPPGSLMEQVFKVNGDQTITMPYYVGPVRGVREAASMQVWHINQMRPRYNQFNWPDMWRNVRLKNKQALMNTVVNQTKGVITVKEVENPPIIVTVTGPTEDASLIGESIVMDKKSKQTVNSYLDYASVKKNRVNNFDVSLSDTDGRLLTVIPNNQLQAHYQILDVSSCPWLPTNTSPLDNYMEILYKRTLPHLSNDEDEFPAHDYDDVVVNKMMQLNAEEQEKVEVAQAYDAKATRTAAWTNEDQNRATEDQVALVSNPHDTMQKRIGTGTRRRYSLYSGRKF